MSVTQRSPITFAVTMLALAFLYVPLAVVVLFSFHATGALSFPFTGFSLRWYEETLSSPEFRAALWNSTVVALSVSFFTLILGTMAAYGLMRCRPRLRAPLAALFFLPITLPGLFVGISLLVYFARLDIQLSFATVAIAHFVFVFPYFFLIATAALDRLDPALEEAASDLGASPGKVFKKVTLPQIWPILAAATALSFALSFDEFIITFFVVGPDPTLPLFIWSSLRRTIDPSINAISTLLLAFTVLLFVVTFAITSWGERRRRGTVDPLVLTGAQEQR